MASSSILPCIDNPNHDAIPPPNVLYSTYKNLSKGVFDKFQGIYDKKQLEEMKQRNLECAKRRIQFQKVYIDPKKHDNGHKKIIDTAIKKALACHVASQPIDVIKKWYGSMRFIYNTIVSHYNLWNQPLDLEGYKNMVTNEIILCKPETKYILEELPPYLLDSCINHAIKMINTYQEHYKGVPLGFLTKKQASTRIFWCLCGFDDDPFVKQLHLSIGNIKQ